ncbi:nucleotidyltransferase family protein [Patescibacteria group bacterium]|nr:nucleotidyltransferase family protein [Patescibacteria group bacterium]MCG2695155.1 nucleotidyltransferase family protein [Candidatus Parcubacteria bacterium]
MNDQDILNLIKKDKWMMKVLKIAEDLDFPDWVIGAGFVRNKVWDHLHGFSNSKVDTPDIDLVYYDPEGNDKKTDEDFSQKLKEQTGINWEIVNEFYAHKFNGIPPYKSTEDALSQWPETATGLGVKLENGNLKLIAPYGIDDLVNLIIRPCPKFPGNLEVVKERAKKKQWFEKWPKLKFFSD